MRQIEREINALQYAIDVLKGINFNPSTLLEVRSRLEAIRDAENARSFRESQEEKRDALRTVKLETPNYRRLGIAYARIARTLDKSLWDGCDACIAPKAKNAPSGQQTQAIDMLEEAYTLLSDIYFMRESFNADRVESFLDRAQPLLKSIHSAGPSTKNAPTVNSDATQPISTNEENSANAKYREHEETERILNAGLTKVLDLAYNGTPHRSYVQLRCLVADAKKEALRKLFK